MKRDRLGGGSFLATATFLLLMASSACCCSSMMMLTTFTTCSSSSSSTCCSRLLQARLFVVMRRPAFHSSFLCFFSSTDHNNNNQQQQQQQQQLQHKTTTMAPGSHCTELLVKKSRFLAYAKSVNSWSQAQDYLNEIKLQHPKARHWCWGYVGLSKEQQQQQQERCSDDGEPTGTAGLPILNAIQGEGLEQVMCVVVRYFGGIKLGAGGLIRSYGAAARQTLREAPRQILEPIKQLRVRVITVVAADADATSSSSSSSSSTCHVGVLYEAIRKVNGVVASGEVYGDDGSLTMNITCKADVEGQLREILQDATRGSVVFLSNDDDNNNNNSSAD